jgi:hypothetical protein
MHHFDDEGTTTVEYAMATIAASLFAGLLIVIIGSGEVKDWLGGVIEKALSVP